jgi:HSP20 family molecular chaperone IbpA
MWAEACQMVEQAERLHRQFFQPSRQAVRQPAWEPPVDICETVEGLRICIALPGVRPDRLEILIGDGAVSVAGVRPLPAASQDTIIHRLEIPYGRFERQIRLPPNNWRMIHQELIDGCLLLSFQRLD